MPKIDKNWSELAVSEASGTTVAQHNEAASDGSDWKTASNKALGKAVRKALAKTKGINSSTIHVLARNGAVTLAGTVPDSAQVGKATEVAKTVDGVTSVKNALSIREVGQ